MLYGFLNNPVQLFKMLRLQIYKVLSHLPSDIGPTHPTVCLLIDLATPLIRTYICFLQPLPTPTMPSFSPPIPIPSNLGCSSALSATPPSGLEDKQQVFPPRLADDTIGEWCQTLLYSICPFICFLSNVAFPYMKCVSQGG